MANVNATPDSPTPLAGAANDGSKLLAITGEAKVTQNDTLTIPGATTVTVAILYDDTTGVLDACTISGNVITLTGAATGTVSGLIVTK